MSRILNLILVLRLALLTPPSAAESLVNSQGANSMNPVIQENVQEQKCLDAIRAEAVSAYRNRAEVLKSGGDSELSASFKESLKQARLWLAIARSRIAPSTRLAQQGKLEARPQSEREIAGLLAELPPTASSTPEEQEKIRQFLARVDEQRRSGVRLPNLQSLALKEYARIIQAKPLLAHIKTADGSDAGAARRSYAQTLENQASALEKVDLKFGTARALVMFKPAVSRVQSQDPNVCANLSSIEKKYQEQSQSRHAMAGATTGAAGACALGAAFTGGSVGLVCLGFGALSAVVGAAASADTAAEKTLLTAGFLGSQVDYAKLDEKESEFMSHLFGTAANLAGTGLMSAGVRAGSSAARVGTEASALSPAARFPLEPAALTSSGRSVEEVARLRWAEEVLGPQRFGQLTPQQQAAILTAHEKESGQNVAKGVHLRHAGFSADETESLLRAGVAGLDVPSGHMARAQAQALKTLGAAKPGEKIRINPFLNSDPESVALQLKVKDLISRSLSDIPTLSPKDAVTLTHTLTASRALQVELASGSGGSGLISNVKVEQIFIRNSVNGEVVATPLKDFLKRASNFAAQEQEVARDTGKFITRSEQLRLAEEGRAIANPVWNDPAMRTPVNGAAARDGGLSTRPRR